MIVALPPLWIIVLLFGAISLTKVLIVYIIEQCAHSYVSTDQQTIVGLEGEMGWKTPVIHRKVNILRFWNRLMKMNNKRLPKMIYMEMKQSSDDWFEDIKIYSCP